MLVVPREKIAPFQIHSIGLNLIMFSNLNVLYSSFNNTQDFSQQNMFVFIFFLGLFEMKPFTVFSKVFHLFHAQTTWHTGKTETHKHLKTLNMCALLQSPVHMKIIWQFTYFQQYFSHILLLVFKLISRDTEKF